MSKIRVLNYRDAIIFYAYFANFFVYPFPCIKNAFCFTFAKVDTLFTIKETITYIRKVFTELLVSLIEDLHAVKADENHLHVKSYLDLTV